MTGQMVGTCINCGKPDDDSYKAVSWVPPGGGASVWAIVSAHIECLTLVQCEQVLADVWGPNGNKETK